MIRRWIAAAAIVRLFVFSGRVALAAAWTEVHQTSGDVRMTFEPDAVVSVEHAFGLHVVMGPIKSFDLLGVDREARLDTDAKVTAEDGRSVPAHVAVVEPT